MPPLQGLKVSDLMTTGLVTVNDTDPISLAESRMETGSMRHLPVVDPHGRLLGILSSRDLLRALREGKRSLRVGQVMSSDLVTTTPRTPAREAVDLLIEKQIGALPVVDEDQQLIGIVTETDFLALSREAFGPRSVVRHPPPPVAH